MKNKTYVFVIACMFLLGLCQASEWTANSNCDTWQFKWIENYDFEAEQWGHSAQFTFPGKTESIPGQSAEIATEVKLPGLANVAIEFLYSDNFTASTAGYHSMALFVNEKQLWSKDVSGGKEAFEKIRVEIGDQFAGSKKTSITFRAITTKYVTNFGVNIKISSVKLLADGGETTLFPAIKIKSLEELPADVDIPSSPVRGLDWTSKACIVQPWGKSQYDLISNVKGKPEKLRDSFGFNTILLQPPAAFNRGKYKHTEEEFQKALTAYRKAGYKIVLYSSIMHCGHGPVWQSGQLTKDNPDWVQRDSAGGVISKYGSFWLCPSTPALDYTLDYTLDLVSKYQPDGIMLDNNEFLYSNHQGVDGPTCYCKYCNEGFRQYVSQRFGQNTNEYFGVDADKIKIPVEKSPLYDLWIHWRNRVWALANEKFRSSLGDVVLFGNTQYLYKTFALATDLQYYHEDLILSESRSHTGYGMSSKMLLASAISGGKPVWNYLGTFTEEDMDILRKPDELASVIAPTMAFNANPYLVYYGFDKHDEVNQPSRDYLQQFFEFKLYNPMLYSNLTPLGKTATIFSTRARNYHGCSLLPTHLIPASKAGFALKAIHDENLLKIDLSQFETIVAEHVSCLSLDEANKLVDWVNRGGRLIATQDIGLYDQIARPRHEPLINKKTSKGKGRIILTSPDNITFVLDKLRTPAIRLTPASQQTDIEVRPYKSSAGFTVLHIVNHGSDLPEGVKLSIPHEIASSASNCRYFSFEKYTTLQLDFSKGQDIIQLSLPDIKDYGVVVLYK